MSFTADEIWGYLPGEREKYVFTGEWYDGLFGLKDEEVLDNSFWDKVLFVKGAVNRALEAEKGNGIRSSLEAKVLLEYDEDAADFIEKLRTLENELRFIFITSQFEIAPQPGTSKQLEEEELLSEFKKGMNIVPVNPVVSKAEGDKCPRCWHYTTDVGKVAEHADICGRCVSNIAGNGEQRKFA